MYFFRKFFYWFYPTNPKFCHTDEGKSIRKIIFWMVMLHAIFSLVSMTIIGFYSMVM